MSHEDTCMELALRMQSPRDIAILTTPTSSSKQRIPGEDNEYISDRLAEAYGGENIGIEKTYFAAWTHHRFAMQGYVFDVKRKVIGLNSALVAASRSKLSMKENVPFVPSMRMEIQCMERTSNQAT